MLYCALYSVDVLRQYTQFHSSHSHFKTVQVHQNKSQHNSAMYSEPVHAQKFDTLNLSPFIAPSKDSASTPVCVELNSVKEYVHDRFDK